MREGRCGVVAFVCLAAISVLVVAPVASFEQTAPEASAKGIAFEPLRKWREAVLAGDAATLKEFYSTDPPATVASPSLKSSNPKDEVKFWSALKRSGVSAIEIELVRSGVVGQGLVRLVFQVEFLSQGKSGVQKQYASVSQDWMKQGAVWRIIKTERTDLARIPLPTSTDANLYPPGVDAAADIQGALARAASTGKRVLLIFGANWCYECHVLETALRSAEVAPLVTENYEVVHVDIGRGERNQDIARRYRAPVERGIPVLSILDSDGKLLFTDRNAEFASAYAFGIEDLVSLLTRWKPVDRGQ